MKSEAPSPPEIVRRLLAGRGIEGDAEVSAYFNPALSDFSPSDLPGIDDAAEAILACDGLVVVFGDYDCDGICASAILVECLRKIGKQVEPFLPERLSEGYGMSDQSVSRMLSLYPSVALVVTVDNGINANCQTRMLREKGVKVVITDHHLPGSELPQADALVNPCVSAPDGMRPLCGAAVAFVLAASLVEKARSRKLYSGGSIAGPMLVMAGLATVTDSMPLTGLNRVMVALAAHHFHFHAPLGLRKLYERSGKSAVVSSRDFGFALGPRINASGRLASGMDALELLLCDDEDIAAESARIIDLCNSDRKKIEQEMVEAALAKVVPGAAAQVIEIETDRPGAVGVIGIVASRVMERIAADDGLSGGRGEVPVCVITAGRGSARSPDRINIRDAMESCSGVLERFGGHAAAAGFSVREGMVDEFRRQLDGYCSALEPEGVARPRAISARERVEAWLEADEVTLDLARWIVRMEPFGEGNAEPVFGLRSVGLSQVRPMGADGRHVQFNVADCNNIRAVWWNRSDRLDELRQKSFARFDLVFTILFSTYGGDHPELRVIDVLPAGEV